MTLEIEGPVFFWKGPAPWYFVAVPERQSKQIHAISKHVSYGWGCITCNVTVGATTVMTALIPKDGLYLVPLKARLRQTEGIEEGKDISIELEIPEGR